MNPREPHLYVPSRSAAGCALFGAAATLVISLFALNNLARAPLSVSGFASMLWLGLCALYTGVGLKASGGLAGLARGALHLFSRVEFVALDGAGHLHHGFVLWGQEFTRASVPLNSLTSVRWSPGQASSMTGEDMDDWSVAIWFRDEELEPDPWGDSLWILGSQEPAPDASLIGERLIAFLRQSGCGLRRDSECGYLVVRPPELRKQR